MAESKILSNVNLNINEIVKNSKKFVEKITKSQKSFRTLSDNVKNLNKGLEDSNKQASKSVRFFNRIKTTGQRSAEVLKKEFNSFWGEFGKQAGLSFGKVAKFTLLYKVFRGFIDIAQQSIRELVDFRDALVDLQRISGITDLEMERLGDSVIDLGNKYGITSLDAVNLTKIWVQQGKQGQELASYMDVTAKATVALGVSAQSASEAITVLSNVFGITSDNIEIYIDKLKSVESRNAVVAQDLVDAYKKVGAASKGSGIDIDTLNGLITTLTQTLRVSGTYAGNFLKILFARTRRPKLLEYLQDIGIISDKNIDSFTNTEQLLSLIASRWDSLASSQQFAIAELTGGLRRFQDFTALMQNYDTVLKVAGDSVNSFGEANNAVDINLKKFSSTINQTKTAIQDFVFSIGGLSVLEGFVALLKTAATVTSAFGKAGDLVGNQLDKLGGGLGTVAKVSTDLTLGAGGLAATLYGVGAALTASGIGTLPGILIAITGGLLSISRYGSIYDILSGRDTAKELEQINKALKEQDSILKSISEVSDLVAYKLVNSFEIAGRNTNIGEILYKSIRSAFPEKAGELIFSQDELNEIKKTLNEISQASGEERQSLIIRLSEQIAEFSGIYNETIRNIENNPLYKTLKKDFEEGEKGIVTLLDAATRFSEERFISLSDGIKEYIKLLKSSQDLNILQDYNTEEPKKWYSQQMIFVREYGNDLEALSGILERFNKTREDTFKTTQKETGFDPQNILEVNADNIEKLFKTYTQSYAKYIKNTKLATDSTYNYRDAILSLLEDDNLIENILGKVIDISELDIFKKNYLKDIIKERLANSFNFEDIFADIETTQLGKFLEFDASRLRSIENALKSENEMLSLKTKQGNISESQLKILKLREETSSRIAETEAFIQSLKEKGTPEDATNVIELETTLKLLKEREAALNNENSLLNLSLIANQKIKTAIEETNEIIKEGESLDKRLDNLIRQNKIQIALAKQTGENNKLTSEQLEVGLRIEELEKERLNIYNKLRKAQANETEDADIYSIKLKEIDELLQKSKLKKSELVRLQETLASLTEDENNNVKDTLSSYDKMIMNLERQFASAFTSLPEKFSEASEQVEEINNKLNQSLNDYNAAVERLKDAEYLYNQFGTTEYANAMESAREDVQSMRDNYATMVEEAKRVNEETNKFKILMTEITDIFQEKLLDRIADTLIESSGVLDSITASAVSLFGGKPSDDKQISPEEKSLNQIKQKLGIQEKKEAENTAKGTKKAGLELMPFFTKAFISASMYSSKRQRIGSILGSIGGALGWFGGSITQELGGLLGGLVGGLFDKDVEIPTEDLPIPNLPEIDRNTDAIIQNTAEIRKMNQEIINPTANLRIPRLNSLVRSQAGGGSVNITVNGFVGNSDELANKISDIVNNNLNIGLNMS